MNPTLTAEDLWPLVLKLPHEEQVRLARLALRAAADSSGPAAEAYRVSPPGRDEFSSEEEPLAWEAEGWDEFDATACALNFDHVALAQRSRLGAVITTLAAVRWPEVERALLLACGFSARSE